MDIKGEPFGLGTSNLASFGRAISVKEADRLIHTALDYNVKIIDTADTYGSGDAERLVGKVLPQSRNDFFLMTKSGFPYCNLYPIFSPLNQFGKKGKTLFGSKKKYSATYLVNSLHASLKRLKTDYVDVFYLHEPTYQELRSFPDWSQGLENIKKSGMARYIGISTSDIEAIRFAGESISLDILQTQANIYSQESKDRFVQLEKLNIPIVGNQFMGLTKLLVNEIGFKSRLYSLGLTEKNIPGILLKFALVNGNYKAMLIGTRNPKHLKENLDFFKDSIMYESLFDYLSSKFTLKKS